MPPVDSPGMPDSEWQRLQRIIADFETSWKRGERPRIGDYLPADEPRRADLLVELVHAELEFRLKGGESARVEDYLRKYPQLERDRSTVFDLIKAERSFRRRREPNLALETYLDRFPGFRDELDGAGSDSSTGNWPEKSSQIFTKHPTLPELPLPRSLGKFELREKLGTGSIAVVYRAWDPILKREVAIKVPRPELIVDQPDLQTFFREARNALHLHHPNIVAIYDASPIEDTVCVVRALVEGTTLADLARQSPLSAEEAAALMALVADALDYAHCRGIFHRDLKPANILVDRQGRPYVSDFGLAKRESGDSTLSQAGQVGTRIGTPAYMSPEQAQGEGYLVDARSDVFSAGVVLYELLTGSLPFRGRGRMLELQTRELDPAPPRSLNEDVPHDLETICLKALAKGAPDRYQSAKGLADDLRKFLGGESIAPRADPLAKPKPPSRWKRSTVVIPVALAIGLFGTTFLWLKAESRADRSANGRAQAIRAMLDLAELDETDRPEHLPGRIADALGELAPGLDGDPALRDLAADVRLFLARRAREEGAERESGPQWARAIALCRALDRGRPEDLPRREDLAEALTNLASLRSRAGDTGEYRRLAEESRELWAAIRSDRERRASERPDDARTLLDLAGTELRFVEATHDSGKLDDPGKPERIALELGGRTSLGAPEKRGLARLCLDISRSKLAARQPARSLEFARMGQRLYQEMPPDRAARVGLARAKLAVARADGELSRGPGTRN